MKLRFTLFYFISILAFGILFFRLFDLTVILGQQNRESADEQRIRLRRIVAPRGVIFDREGKPLVRNAPVFKKCEVGSGKCEGLSRDEALRLEAQNKDSDLVTEVGREYLYGESMAHLLGYLGEVSEAEVESGKLATTETLKDTETRKPNKKLCDSKFGAGDLVGRTGIEEQYDCLLRGQDGGELIEVDTYGVTLRKLGKREPVGGQDIFLSLDANLQKAAYEALKGKKGAVVASDPTTGEILALVSSPSFDPNNFDLADLTAQDKPMFNRAIGGAYPPGSTFKIVTSSAGLEEGKITPKTEIVDPGEIVIGAYRFGNWYFSKYGKTEGSINVVRAIARSTDTFFYKVGEYVGARKLVEWAGKFGLGKRLGIDLPGEIGGFLPDPTNPPAGGWFLGNTYHLAIGQGALGVTPLQLNLMTNVVANGGKLCRPAVVLRSEKWEVKSGKKEVGGETCKDVGVKKETLETIREGLREACSPGGTAGIFFNFNPKTACKTGTAEFNDPAGRTHAWFTSYAPADKPEISVTALVEAGGEGSVVAAPIVKKVFEEWFRNN